MPYRVVFLSLSLSKTNGKVDDLTFLSVYQLCGGSFGEQASKL